MRVTAAALVAATLMLSPGVAVPEPSQSGVLREMVEFVLAVHPAPYRYVDAATLERRLQDEERRLAALATPDDLEKARSMHRVLASLGDSHLALALPSLQPAAGNPLPLLPLLPQRVGDRVFVDASEPPLPAGTVLLEIDGMPVEELYERMAPLVFVDGHRPEVRRARLDRDFTLPFHLAFGAHPEYRARVRLPNGEEVERSFPAVARETIVALHGRRISAPLRGRSSNSAPPWPFLYEAGGVQVLRLPSFGIPDQEGYRRKVDELLSSLRGDEPLALDLRGNRGGLRTHGMAVLDHVIDGPYVQWQRIATRVRDIPARFRTRVTFPFAPPEALREFPGEPRGGLFVYEGDPLADRMRGGIASHRGEIYAFVDDGTDSAAVEMLAALLAHRTDVTVVGAETGGECGRHIGEIPVMYSTAAGGPALRLLVSLAAITHVDVAGCAPGRGFVPDRPVIYTEEDFLGGRDPYLAAVRRP